MKSFELAVNIERVIRSLKNTWTIIKLVRRGTMQPGCAGVGGGLVERGWRAGLKREMEERGVARRGWDEEGETTGSGHR